MFVHGANLLQKENHKTKYMSDVSKRYLVEIREKYDEWHKENDRLKGPFIDADVNDGYTINKRVELLNQYKEFLDQQHYAEHFDSRSNLHSSVIEEFIYYLFRDLAKDFNEEALVGKSHAFKDLFINPSSFKDMVTEPNVRIEKKDHDFVIGSRINTKMKVAGSDVIENHTLEVPAIAIECKTYLDKTMLEASSNAAEQLKSKNPNAKYIVVSEWIKLTDDINLKKYKVDQIYVLRKQKNTDREFRYLDGYQKKSIYPDVIEHLFENVKKQLVADWEGGIEFGLQKGFLI